MNSFFQKPLALWTLCALLVGSIAVRAQQPPPATPPAEPANPPAAAAAADPAPTAEPPLRPVEETATSTTVRSDRSEFPFGNHYVPRGGRARDAVSVFGSTTVEGEVSGDVVSIMGDSTIGPDARVGGAVVAVLGRIVIDGPVKDDAVSVLGGARINNRVDGDAVVVLGSFELGPRAVIDGDVVLVGGQLKRHPDAVIRGNVVNVPVLGGFGDIDWLVTWFKRCLLMGRPLAFGQHLGWAWVIAASFLGLYLVFALIFPRGIEKCVTTLETRPGYSILSSVLTVFLSPVAIVLLAVTVVGVLVIPFATMGLFIAKLFGKAVMLAWIGRRFTRFFGDGPLGHPVFAVLLGGVLVMLLYTVPVFGFLLYKLLTWLGLGVVVYTIALGMKRDRPPGPKPIPGVVPGRPVAPAPAAVPVAPAAATLGYQVEAAAPGSSSGVAAGFAASSADFMSGSGIPAAPEPAVASAPPPVIGGVVISAATLPRAGFLIRIGALALDLILVGMVVGFAMGMFPRGLRLEPPSILMMLAIYGAVMWKLRGTTIGGVVCGLKVVRMDDRPIDWATSIVRALSCFLSLVVAGLGFIWIAIDDEKQGWHDKIAGTVVVRVPKGVSLL